MALMRLACVPAHARAQADQPIPFIYINLVYLISIFYLPMFSYAVAHALQILPTRTTAGDEVLPCHTPRVLPGQCSCSLSHPRRAAEVTACHHHPLMMS